MGGMGGMAGGGAGGGAAGAGGAQVAIARPPDIDELLAKVCLRAFSHSALAFACVRGACFLCRFPDSATLLLLHCAVFGIHPLFQLLHCLRSWYLLSSPRCPLSLPLHRPLRTLVARGRPTARTPSTARWPTTCRSAAVSHSVAVRLCLPSASCALCVSFCCALCRFASGVIGSPHHRAACQHRVWMDSKFSPGHFQFEFPFLLLFASADG